MEKEINNMNRRFCVKHFKSNITLLVYVLRYLSLLADALSASDHETHKKSYRMKAKWSVSRRKKKGSTDFMKVSIFSPRDIYGVIYNGYNQDLQCLQILFLSMFLEYHLSS